MLFKKKQAVCIEIRDDVIRYVELKSIDPIVVKKYGEKAVPKGVIGNGRILIPEAFKIFLESCVREWKIKRKPVIFVEPDETVAIKKVAVPLDISEEEMRAYLYQALGESIILPFDEPAIDYVMMKQNLNKTTQSYFEPVENQKKTRDVLLVATPDDLVSSYSEAFRSNHLEPEAVDISPLCYYRLYLDQLKTPYLAKEVMVLQVDNDNVTISIFEDNIPIFMQYEELFSVKKDWKEEGEKAKDMQERFKTLRGDLDRILHFYQFSISKGNIIKEIILVGENPYLDELSVELENELNLKINKIEEKIKTVTGEIVPKRYHLAIGLGLKGVDYDVSRY